MTSPQTEINIINMTQNYSTTSTEHREYGGETFEQKHKGQERFQDEEWKKTPG